MNRLRELDFLRGIAIVLVLFRHIPLFTFTINMGWIGVDLFFVLSGFLISGLLFREYLKYGNIKAKLFLIRRGFKIYPIYFLFYIPYIIPIILKHELNLTALLAELVFFQNYVTGWGYAFAATWSLAIEEHFYFGFVFFLWLALKYRAKIYEKWQRLSTMTNKFEIMVVAILITVFVLRLCSNVAYPDDRSKLFTMTHLRIDSLLFGVFISYLYYFKLNFLNSLFNKYKTVFFVVFILGISWTPFINPIPSFFVKTIGFSMLYLAFGALLVIFLLQNNINQTINKLFTRNVVNVISKIGYCSYSIYIIHELVILWMRNSITHFNLPHNRYLFFVIAATLSVLAGMFMTYKIEAKFLAVRDKYYPRRV